MTIFVFWEQPIVVNGVNADYWDVQQYFVQSMDVVIVANEPTADEVQDSSILQQDLLLFLLRVLCKKNKFNLNLIKNLFNHLNRTVQ